VKNWIQVRAALSKWTANADDPISCAREISELRFTTPDPKSSHFFIFLAIDSETDEFPTGLQRAHWNRDSLRRSDAERDAYLARISEDFWRHCRDFERYIDAM
jgi:hypothetical protein